MSTKITSNEIELTSGESVMNSQFNITAANGTYQDTGLEITLPSAGTYLFSANVRGFISATELGAFIVAKLYNSTDSSYVVDSEMFVVQERITSSSINGNVSQNLKITVDGSKVIKLHAFRSGGTTYQSSAIIGDTNGRTRMSYLRIA